MPWYIRLTPLPSVCLAFRRFQPGVGRFTNVPSVASIWQQMAVADGTGSIQRENFTGLLQAFSPGILLR